MHPTLRACFVATLCLVGLPSFAQAKFHGKVTHQIGGSVGHLPETRPLGGATVLIGKDLHLEIGATGIDKVKGKVLAKDLTESSGTFSVTLPAGSYTVICWKQGYVPQVERQVAIPGQLNLDIGKDASGRGLHRELAYGQ
jgi:hypothetical protein